MEATCSTKLHQIFYEDLKKLSLFDEAIKLVKETYKLEVEVNKSETEFTITGNGTELLEFVQTLLESWLERKKKKQSVKFEDKIKVTKENPFSDIIDGHAVWVFWGDLASKLSSGKCKNEVEKLRLVQGSSVSVQYEKMGRLHITCNFKTFKDVKPKVENLKLLVASGRHDLDKLQIPDTCHTDDSKGNSSQDSEKGKIKEKDNKGTSEFNVTACGDNQNKSVNSETSTHNGENLKQSALRQSKGASGGQNLLEGSDSGSDQSSQNSGSKDKSTDDDRLLFCTLSGRTKVFVYEASIVNLSGIEAIVNAANERLDHAGGVAYHIFKAAGSDKSALEIECRSYIRKNKKVDVTKNFTSSAGNMPYHGVIHAVGPMWSDYKVKEDCAKDLCMTIMNVLVEADTRKFSKIALPAISSGIYGEPKRLCAEMYIKGVIDYDSRNPQTQVKEIHFVDTSKDILQDIRDAYGRWKQNDKSLDFKNANSYSSTSENPSRDISVIEDSGSDSEISSDFVTGTEQYGNDEYLPVQEPGNEEIWLRRSAHSQREAHKQNLEADNYPHCMDTLTSPKKLLCEHELHGECTDHSLEYRQICPVCGTHEEHFTGNQPTGIMYHNVRKDIHLPGFEDYNTLEICYKFLDGIQGVDHPHPGKPYKGVERKAFLPNNPEGKKVLQRLRVAFDRKLIFTVGDSQTSKMTDVIIWNGIQHKTSIKGGPSQYGYPDRDYLTRVQEELAGMGVTEKDIQDADETRDIEDRLENFAIKKEKHTQGGILVETPKHWTDMKSTEILKVVTLDLSSPECTQVVLEFHRSSGSRRQIVKAERIQNVTLYAQYMAKERELEIQNSHKNNERILWHGTTPNAVSSINMHGFNRSYCGKNAAAYGNGVYFAVSASYSVKETYSTPDSHGHKRMYQCRVLTGDYTQGRKGIIVPPRKSSKQTHILYDSVVDKPKDPKIFVIFHDSQAYPDYLVTFK